MAVLQGFVPSGRLDYVKASGNGVSKALAQAFHCKQEDFSAKAAVHRACLLAGLHDDATKGLVSQTPKSAIGWVSKRVASSTRFRFDLFVAQVQNHKLECRRDNSVNEQGGLCQAMQSLGTCARSMCPTLERSEAVRVNVLVLSGCLSRGDWKEKNRERQVLPAALPGTLTVTTGELAACRDRMFGVQAAVHLVTTEGVFRINSGMST